MRKLVLLAVLAMAAAIAAAEPKVGVSMTPAIEPDRGSFAHWRHGAISVVFEVSNPTASPIDARVGFIRSDGGFTGTTTHVEPGATARVPLRLPFLSPSSSSYFSIYIYTPMAEVRSNGRKVDFNKSFSATPRHYSGSEQYGPSILASPRLDSGSVIQVLSNAMSSVISPHIPSWASASNQDIFAGRIEFARTPCASWPAHWADYSRYDSIVAGQPDWDEMNPAARLAIGSWVAAGGTLVFAASDAPQGLLPPRSQLPVVTPAPEGFPAVIPVGFGRVMLVPADPLAWSHVACSAIVDSAIDSLLSFSLPSSYGADMPFSSHYSIKSAGVPRTFADFMLMIIPIPGASASVPMALSSVILVLFVILAGPVATILLARRNRRIWLFWVVPAMSLVFSLAITASVVIREGVRPTVRRQAITLLDQQGRHASTLGAIGVYAPVSLGRSLDFEVSTDITAIHGMSMDSAEIGEKIRLDGRAIAPRTPAFASLRRSEERHERLEIKELSDGVEVLNALGAPVAKLTVVDSHGRICSTSDPIAPGERRFVAVDEQPSTAALQINPSWLPSAVFGRRPVADAPSGDLGGIMRGWGLANPAKGLSPAIIVPEDPSQRQRFSYTAELDGCPFIEDPLAGAKAKRSDFAIVVGTYQP